MRRRLLLWLPSVFLCYTLTAGLLSLAALLQSQALSSYICRLSIIFCPLVAAIAEPVAFLVPGRKALSTSGTFICLLMLPCINGLLCYASGLAMTHSYAWPAAPAITGFAAAAFTLLSLLIPLVSSIRNAWCRTLASVPVSWFWGLTLAVFIGGIIDCIDHVGLQPVAWPVAWFPYSIFILPLLTIGGLLPGIIPLCYIEKAAESTT